MQNHRAQLLVVCQVALLPVLLGSCGVPRLYTHPESGSHRSDVTSGDPERFLAPKVDHIITEVACELADASRNQLGGQPYLITVLLTLQVDDNLDLTPSFSLMRSLAGGTESQSSTLSADIGGGRRRTFTTTYYIESEKLAKQTHSDLHCTDPGGKLLRLDGNLGLFEIARDGTGVMAGNMGTLHPPTGPADKAISTFGSLVQFTVTRGVSALGPVWTLKRFKGPSGSNGLVNGKRLNTDSVALTFAPIVPAADTESADKDLIAKQGKKLAAHALTLSAQVAHSVALRNQHSLASLRTGRLLSPELQRNVQLADEAVRTTQSELEVAQAREAEATREANDAQTRRDALAVRSQVAVDAGQSLLQSILLQNLNLQQH